MAKDEFKIELNQDDFDEAMDELQKIHDSLDERYLKNTLKRKSKPILQDMKQKSPSTRLKQVMGISTAKKRTKGRTTVKIGVIKNNPSLFPDFSSWGLASVLEYGTDERYKKTSSLGFITGRTSTGDMRAHGFLRGAFDRNIEKVLSDFSETIEKRVNKN